MPCQDPLQPLPGIPDQVKAVSDLDSSRHCLAHRLCIGAASIPADDLGRLALCQPVLDRLRCPLRKEIQDAVRLHDLPPAERLVGKRPTVAGMHAARSALTGGTAGGACAGRHVQDEGGRLENNAMEPHTRQMRKQCGEVRRSLLPAEGYCRWLVAGVSQTKVQHEKWARAESN